MVGFVSLVGAGPGDPELLTLKALRALEQADLVLYDALVNTDVLELAAQARRFCVGKRGHQPSFDQKTIERLLIVSAGRGERVVRLKCGDPFVLGRGGEEALALAAAKIPFEIVPGITSSISAPLLAGIPVTHRGISSGFSVISGHTEKTWGPLIDAQKPNVMTMVVLMGFRQRARIATYLLERGWRGETPVALLLAASMDDAKQWIGTLAELASPTPELDENTAPGTLVVGEVVTVAEELRGLMADEPDCARTLANPYAMRIS